MKTKLGYHIEAFPEVHGMQDMIIKGIMDAKEAVFRQVIEQVIGRPSIPEDARDFTFVVKEGVPDKEIITYKGRPIGAMTFYTEGFTVGFRFDPGVTNF